MEYTMYGGTRYRVQSADAGIRENDRRLDNEALQNDKLAQFCAGVEKRFQQSVEEWERKVAEWKERREHKSAEEDEMC